LIIDQTRTFPSQRARSSIYNNKNYGEWNGSRSPRKSPADNLEAAQFKIYRVFMKLRRIRSPELPRGEISWNVSSMAIEEPK
jgi:hypothetical protein